MNEHFTIPYLYQAKVEKHPFLGQKQAYLIEMFKINKNTPFAGRYLKIHINPPFAGYFTNNSQFPPLLPGQVAKRSIFITNSLSSP
jgi:hypothetical protein